MELHPELKKVLGYPPRATNSEVLSDWKKRARQTCKPCWELKYCPYGPLVEDFPLPPITRDEDEEHRAMLQSCLKSGYLKNGQKLDPARRRLFRAMLSVPKRDLPEKIHPFIGEVACRVFGHICPVFFVAEPLTETADRRKATRSIPRDVMLKVVRRDGQICQKCNPPVADDEVEFDHVIPFSKGGTTTTENLRLIHRRCNRAKSASLNELLAENPLVHLYEIQRSHRSRKKNA
jgi:5-methylcytosine-specific restriction endonuclease McrA